MIRELIIWLSALLLTFSVIQYFSTALIFAFIFYFVLVRMLERITVSEDLTQRPVLITGCGSGFGFNLALKCIDHGIPVFATFHSDKGKQTLEKKAMKLRHGRKLLHTLTMNIADDASVAQARRIVEEKLTAYNGGLWAVVNNAGAIGIGWDDWMTPKHYVDTLDVNTIGMIRVTHAFKHLVKASRGRIIIMSSILGRLPLPIMGAYCVSKFATTCYADVLAAELASHGVTVIAMEAGFYRTPITDLEAASDKVRELYRSTPSRTQEEYDENYLKWTLEYCNAMDKMSSARVEEVTEAYFSALTSAFPRRKWQVGVDSKYILTPLSFLPSRWLEWIYRFYFRVMLRRPPVNSTISRSNSMNSSISVLSTDLNNNSVKEANRNCSNDGDADQEQLFFDSNRFGSNNRMVYCKC